MGLSVEDLVIISMNQVVDRSKIKSLPGGTDWNPFVANDLCRRDDRVTLIEYFHDPGKGTMKAEHDLLSLIDVARSAQDADLDTIYPYLSLFPRLIETGWGPDVQEKISKYMDKYDESLAMLRRRLIKRIRLRSLWEGRRASDATLDIGVGVGTRYSVLREERGGAARWRYETNYYGTPESASYLVLEFPKALTKFDDMTPAIVDLFATIKMRSKKERVYPFVGDG